MDFVNLVNEKRCKLISQLSGGVTGGEYGFFVGVEEFIRNLEKGTLVAISFEDSRRIVVTLIFVLRSMVAMRS